MHPVVERLLRAIEQSDEATLLDVFAEDAQQIEFPNRLLPNGATRDRAALLEGFRRGKQVIREQRFELQKTIVSGDDVAYECIWTATLAASIGSLNPGDTMRARFGVFLTLRDGKIVSQRNYDCFDPF
jgi:ketosteroid isomerase-like protein